MVGKREGSGRTKQDGVRRYFPYKEGIPKHGAIARALSRLDTEALQELHLMEQRGLRANERRSHRD